jgi:hypothetical protein
VYICPPKQYFVIQVEIQQSFKKISIVMGIKHGGIIAMGVYVCGIPHPCAQGNGICNYSKLHYNILQRSRIYCVGNRPIYSRNGQNMKAVES